MVEFRGVSKLFGRPGGGRVEALSDVSFEVKPGDVVVVVGPSGAGKSTLLRLVTGEERPSRGAVLVDGVAVADLSARRLARLRRTLGIVSQPGRLLDECTVTENLTRVLRALGTGRREARERAATALGDAGLAAMRDARPAELAEGERRRLLLARALATRPRLLVADEPVARADPAELAAVAGLVRAAVRAGGTALVATAVPELAPTLQGRRLELAGGRLCPEAPAG